MPVIVDYSRCDHHNCFPLEVCPHTGRALLDDGVRIVAHPEICGDCPAPCLNFCDKNALRYAPDLEELKLVQAELDGSITRDEIEAIRAEKKAAEVKAKEAAAAGAVVAVKTAEFETQVLQSDIPVAVDFWAPWCGPCKQMAPVFEELAKSYAGVMRFCKINTDDEQALAMRFQIQGIPTLIFFWQGQELDRVTGALPPSTLQTVVYQLLAAIQQQKAQAQPPQKSPLL
ncbi:MAG TPA: thioredoxin [Chloroflexota bacterium]|nr:thioredoxin [Chloroflexota bacterium]